MYFYIICTVLVIAVWVIFYIVCRISDCQYPDIEDVETENKINKLLEKAERRRR